jgi:hypothetical protein
MPDRTKGRGETKQDVLVLQVGGLVRGLQPLPVKITIVKKPKAKNAVARSCRRIDEMAMSKRVLKGKLYAKRRIGRPRLRWTDDVTDDLRKMEIRGWTEGEK